MENFTPKKCCIKLDPPTLVLFYLNDKGKLHRRSIPVRDMKETSSIDELRNELMKTHHGKYLRKIEVSQLNRLLKKLKDSIYHFGNASFSPSKTTSADGENENFNKLDDNELDKVKERMSEDFEKNRIKPDDADWKYDVEVDFGDPGMNKIESGWDSADDSDLEF